MAAGILILWECYVIEVTVINCLLATGTAASPVKTLTSHPYSLPCPYPPALTPIVSWDLTKEVGYDGREQFWTTGPGLCFFM